MLIDTHCHLNDPDKFESVEEEIRLAAEAGVGRMIVVGVNPAEWQSTLRLAEAHEELFCILGWHPNYTREYGREKLEELRTLAEQPKCLAIGEIGLDLHWDYSPLATQLGALRDQLDLAQELNLPVVFHAREAYSELLDLLESRPERPYLFHCFAGSAEDARRAVALDAYFGVDGPITYRNADALREVVRTLPRDRIVLETDAPYLSPTPMRGKPNRPAYVGHVNEGLAAVLNLSAGACAALCTENSIRFFGCSLEG